MGKRSSHQKRLERTTSDVGVRDILGTKGRKCTEEEVMVVVSNAAEKSSKMRKLTVGVSNEHVIDTNGFCGVRGQSLGDSEKREKTVSVKLF